MQNSKYDPREFEDCVIPNGQKLAIIIPFRDDGSNIRTNQLKVLLHYMIPILIRQNVMFQFFFVTQVKKAETHLRDRKKSFRFFFQLCSQQCCILQTLTNRLRQTPPPNSNGNMLFEFGGGV